MALVILVNLCNHVVRAHIKDRLDLDKTKELIFAPRSEHSVDEGLFTPHIPALLRQGHLKIKKLRNRDARLRQAEADQLVADSALSDN